MKGKCWRCAKTYTKDWRNIFRIPGVALCDSCRAEFRLWWVQRAAEYDARRKDHPTMGA